MRSVEKAFDKMDKDKKKQDKEAKKRSNRDVWTVLAILASVMILALSIAWLKSGEAVVKKFVGEDPEQAKQIFETTRNVLFGAGFISIIVVVVYIVKRIKYKKKPEVERTFIDYDRLDAARARVEKARMERDGKTGEMGVYNAYDTYSEDGVKTRKPNGMSEAEYRKMRQEEYERYMSVDFLDDKMSRRGYGLDEENPELEEELTFIEKIKEFASEHKLVIGVGAGALVLGIVAIVCLLLL